MQRLREVCGEQTLPPQQQQPQQQNQNVLLDEQTISRSELNARKEDSSVRIVEVGQDEYKTLHRLRG